MYAVNDGNIVRYLPTYSTGLVRLLLRTVRNHLRNSGELNDVDQLSAGPIPSAPTFDEAWLDTPEADEMEESLHYDNISWQVPAYGGRYSGQAGGVAVDTENMPL